MNYAGWGLMTTSTAPGHGKVSGKVVASHSSCVVVVLAPAYALDFLEANYVRHVLIFRKTRTSNYHRGTSSTRKFFCLPVAVPHLICIAAKTFRVIENWGAIK